MNERICEQLDSGVKPVALKGSAAHPVKRAPTLVIQGVGQCLTPTHGSLARPTVWAPCSMGTGWAVPRGLTGLG